MCAPGSFGEQRETGLANVLRGIGGGKEGMEGCAGTRVEKQTEVRSPSVPKLCHMPLPGDSAGNSKAGR